ncbi:MAG: N-6 DNA methylase [Flavobacteriales bacterium]|jgi:type I restriction-modification system DNA methylase subunit|nr:N-6 DNA methylase [Flavobacteriales bacterium]
MPLFQSAVLNKYLKQQDDAAIRAAYARFRQHFHAPEIQANIRNSKEEQYQEGFLRDLFVDILGYTLNPQPGFQLTTEFKNEKGNKKADGAILQQGKALAVIELKGTDTTDLASINPQAFHYKANHTDCVYVVTSNFERLRFFIDNAVEHLEFDLFTLTEEQFRLLWLCLQRDNLLGGIPKKVKAESLQEEEQVTKRLYKDYSAFKTALWQDLCTQHPEHDKLLLYKKTQKLLDRFLFVLFGEDKGLLPPNTLRGIVDQWQKLRELDEYRPLYERCQKYFGYLNTGHKSPAQEIFAYNGGLFKPDELLDGVRISDAVLEEHLTKLTKYDFASEVDVNILGHIFEHSLNEIEAITAELEGRALDTKKTKRKKDGVFYTPKYITKYIVENTVGRLCTEKKDELAIVDEEYARGRKGRQKKTIQELLTKLDVYRDWLLSLTICDPACGSGAFLNQALEYLINEHAYVNELESQVRGESIVFKDIGDHILERNIYGVDINEESVEIARLSLWLRTATKGRKLNDLSGNIKCGNSLIDDPAVAGAKAFDWKKEFPGVFAKGGFDVVIGNPPYVFARENFDQSEKDFYVKHYKGTKFQINTYILFIERTVQVLQLNGIYALIVPNSWLMVYSGANLREVLLETCQLRQIINLQGYSFEGVNVETIILVASKSEKKDQDFDVLLNNGQEFYLSHQLNQNAFRANDGLEFKVFADEESSGLTAKLKAGSKRLDDITIIKAGLKAYESRKGEPKQTPEDVKARAFDHLYKKNDNTHRYLEGKDVNRYSITWAGQYLEYGVHLAAPREFEIFNSEKLIIREITGKYPRSVVATYSDELFLFNMSNIAVNAKPGEPVLLKYILALLNSTVMSYYFMKNTAKSVRKMFPKIILQDLRNFPIRVPSLADQKPFVVKVDTMLATSKELNDVTGALLKLLQSKYTHPTLSRALENWPSLEFKGFLSELKKAKVSLTLAEEAEWLSYFTEQKAKAQALQAQIEKTDREIDALVYQLYGLTEEEIRLVEGSA